MSGRNIWFAEGRKVFDENRLTVCDASSTVDAQAIVANADLIEEIRVRLDGTVYCVKCGADGDA